MPLRHFLPILGLLACLGNLVAVASAAAETPWQRAFSGDNVASYLREGDKSLLVVAGGEPSADLTEATAALVASLRAHKPALTVLTGEALGNVTALDDEAITNKAKHLPAALFAIVRVFAGEQPTAVVSFLDKAGKPVTALSVARGTVLAPGGKSGGNAGAGVTTAAADAIARIRDEKRDGKDMQGGLGLRTGDDGNENEEYAANYIGFQDWVGVNRYGQAVSSFSTMYKGSLRRPIDLEAFYSHVGRADLADSARARGRVRIGLIGGGAVMMLSSLIFLKDLQIASCYQPSDKVQAACEAESSAKNSYAVKGMVITGGVGLVAMFAGLFVSSNPLSSEETYAMAGDYNRKMRQRLGLRPQAWLRTQVAKPELLARLSAPGADIGGLSLGLRF